ncbi:6969_t:CDS:2, partial [Gigaspora margarita]
MNPSPITNSINILSQTLTPDQKHALFFNINEPFEILLQEFNDEWQLVRGDSWKFYICHFSKHNQSSSRKENIPDKKCCVTKIWPSNLCFAKIKVSRYISKLKVRVEQCENSSDHEHLLEESNKLKRSQTVHSL